MTDAPGADPLDIDARAKALYERCAPVAPKWEQLGEATKSVWRESLDNPLYRHLVQPHPSAP